MDYDREIWFLYGKILLERKHPVLKRYLEKEERARLQIADRLQRAGTDGAFLRLRGIEKELGFIREALRCFR